METTQTDQPDAQPLAKSSKSLSSRAGSFANSIAAMIIVVGLMWIVLIVDKWLLRNVDLTVYGIHPRTLEGLWQIPLAPFIHADFGHLLANTIPLLILGYLIIVREHRYFLLVFIVATIVSGLGIWTFGGANTVHIGASGVVFGFMGYLLARSFFERSFISIVFAFVALLLYGGILIGVLPGQPGISWLGHLFGLAGGVLAAWAAHRRK